MVGNLFNKQDFIFNFKNTQFGWAVEYGKDALHKEQNLYFT